METIIYFIRHAQSHPTYKLPHDQWPLSERGHKQSSQIKTLVHDLEIDHFFSSPFIRCINTLSPYCDFYNTSMEIVDDLRERHVTTEVRKDFTSIWQKSWEDFSFALPGCESSFQAQKRFIKSIKNIVSRCKGKKIGISTHGNVIGLFLNYINPENNIEVASGIRNPDILKVTFDNHKYIWDKEFSISKLNYISTFHNLTPIEYNSL